MLSCGAGLRARTCWTRIQRWWEPRWTAVRQTLVCSTIIWSSSPRSQRLRRRPRSQHHTLQPRSAAFMFDQHCCALQAPHLSSAQVLAHPVCVATESNGEHLPRQGSAARRTQAPAMVPFKSLQLGPLLGRGSYGRCYRGSYKGQPVAVKVRPACHATQRRPCAAKLAFDC